MVAERRLPKSAPGAVRLRAFCDGRRVTGATNASPVRRGCPGATGSRDGGFLAAQSAASAGVQTLVAARAPPPLTPAMKGPPATGEATWLEVPPTRWGARAPAAALENAERRSVKLLYKEHMRGRPGL